MTLIYFNDNWIWITPTIENILFVFTLLLVGDISVELIWFSKNKNTTLQPIWSRLFSVSHLTAFFGALMFLFEIPIFRALIWVMIPFLIAFFIIVFFVIQSERKSEYKKWALRSHAWHTIFVCTMIIKQWFVPWYYILIAAAFWNFVLFILWLKDHNYKMMFTIKIKYMFLVTNISALFFA